MIMDVFVLDGGASTEIQDAHGFQISIMDVFVLDGGASTEIQDAHGFQISTDPLWSSRLLITNPDIIKKTHRSFLDCGADIIETISYQATIPFLCEHANLSIDDAKATLQKSVHLARETVEEFWQDYRRKMDDSDSTTLADRRKPMVCACIGPYGTTYCSGEEYNGEYIDHISEEDIISLQRPRIEALVSAGVDYFALETIPAQKEAEVVSRLMREHPSVKTWLTFQCKDGSHTGHGEKFSDAVEAVVRDGHIRQVGVNCCSPTDVAPLLESIQQLRQEYSLKLVAYPNNGQIYEEADLGTPGRMIGPSLMSEYASALPRWIDLGATIVGGCCQTTPKDIKIVRDLIDKISVRKT